MNVASKQEAVPVTGIFADKVAATRYEDLPAAVVRVCREVVLDGAANMVAGSREPLAGILGAYVTGLGGPKRASVIGLGFKTHPVHAAFANGTFCHSMDYEMMWDPPTHPTGPVLPVVLALAEERDLPGRDACTALALGFEIQARMRISVVASGAVEGGGIHPPGSVGPFGAAGAAGKLLGLDRDHIRNAMGIAGSRVAALPANKGTMTKSTHCGHAARMGLECALLAELGFTGADDIIEGHRGYSDIFYDKTLDLALMVDGFGAPWRMVEPGLAVKCFPAQYYTHWSIGAALALRAKHKLDPARIESVEVEVGADNSSADRPNPKTGLDGKFSLHYTVAIALLDGAVKIDSFTDQRRFAPDVDPMIRRIRIVKNPGVSAVHFATAWSRVTVRTRDGQEYTERVDRPLGIWDNPLSWEGRVEKFEDCALRVLSPAAVRKAVAMIAKLEELPSLRPLMTLLRGSPPAPGAV